MCFQQKTNHISENGEIYGQVTINH